MKKILAVLVVLMLILTVFAACGRRNANTVGTDSFPDLPNASSKVNSTGTPSKEVTSAEIEDAWGDTSLSTGTGDNSSVSSTTSSGTQSNTSSSVTSSGNTSSGGTSGNTSSGGTSGNTSSSSKPGNTLSTGSTYDPNTSSNMGFNPYYPPI